MANPLKGEIDLKLGSESYKVRLTVDSIMQIETAVGCGIIKLAQKMSDGDIRLSDLVTVLTFSLRNGGNNITDKDVIKIVQNVGIVETTKAVAEIIAKSLSNDSEEEIEGKHIEE